MAAIKSVDHKGMEFPSFKAMCEHWEKKPDTVRKRLKEWTIDIHYDGNPQTVPDVPLQLALEIPEIPGYRFNLKFISLDNKYLFSVKINPKYIQYEKFDTRHTRSTGRIGKLYTLEQIKENFPMTMRQFQKGQLLGIY